MPLGVPGPQIPSDVTPQRDRGHGARRDVAIYQPQAAQLYERSRQRAGGAERQTFLLARALARRGLHVAHIVYPVRDPVTPAEPGLEILHRAPRASDPARESARIWSVLRRADAQVHIVRTATPALGPAGLFARRAGRALIFSSASDGDFTLETIARRSVPLYRLGTRLSDAVVVQTQRQVELAHRLFPGRSVREIPSFFEAPPAPLREGRQPATPGAFLWVGRLVDYKRPLEYLALAAALPEARFRMIGVTTSDTVLPQAIREQAEALSNVELLDPRSHAQTLELIAQAPALVSTSRLEGMPNVFLEAWALGVPVISLSFDPDGRITRHGLGTVADGDWEAFVQAVRRAWRGDADRPGLAAAAARYMADHHAEEAVSAAWLELIEPMLART